MSENKTIDLQTNISYVERISIAEQLIASHPNYIPVILEKDAKSKLPFPKKSKYLFNKNYRMNMIIPSLKKNIILSPEQSLFLMINGKYSISGNDLLYEVYNKFKRRDGFLYITYSSELIWGNSSN